MRVIETNVYQYDELSDKAKEKAREWFRMSIFADSSDWEFVIEDFVQIAEILGISVDTHDVRLMSGKTRENPSVWFSLGYSQSDYASFDGTYSYNAGCGKAIRKYAPLDHGLHAIADELVAIQKRNFYRLEARIKSSNFGNIDVDVSDRDNPYRDLGDDEKAVRDAMRDLCRWLYCHIRDEYESQCEDEAVEENIRANEYEFDEDGERV